MLLHICANLWLKILKFGGSKNLTTSWHLKNPKKSALFSSANSQSVTYSKIQTRMSRVPWGPPMDWFLMKSVNAEYPLSCWKCVEKRTFAFYALLGPLSVSHPPKMVPPYSLGTCPPTNPKTLWCPIAPSLRKNWFSEGIFFWQITRTALESPKIDICLNWPRRVLGDVIRCLEPKFDKKIPIGSVPNCQKEIFVRHAIRWFKCKLKPPKNRKRNLLQKYEGQKLPWFQEKVSWQIKVVQRLQYEQKHFSVTSSG